MATTDFFSPKFLGKNPEVDLDILREWLEYAAFLIKRLRARPTDKSLQKDYLQMLEEMERVVDDFFNNFTVFSESDATHWTHACLHMLTRLRAGEFQGDILGEEWILAPTYQRLKDHCDFRVMQQDGDVARWRSFSADCKATMAGLPKPDPVQF